jgi:hypothetical protein
MMECNLFPESGIRLRKSGARLSYLVLAIILTATSRKTEN